MSSCSVLPKYLKQGGPPGLIHWKIIAAWLKTDNLTQCKLIHTQLKVTIRISSGLRKILGTTL